MTYHDDPEDVSEINPAYIAKNITAKLMIRNGDNWTVNPDGTSTHYFPVGIEGWGPVPVIVNPDNCRHGLSVCVECVDSWNIDYFVRFFHDDVMVWQSDDFPVGPDDPQPPNTDLGGLFKLIS